MLGGADILSVLIALIPFILAEITRRVGEISRNSEKALLILEGPEHEEGLLGTVEHIDSKVNNLESRVERISRLEDEVKEMRSERKRRQDYQSDRHNQRWRDAKK